MVNSNSMIYRVPDDVLEEVFLLLPVKSILRCRCVSKHWRSILESKEFVERRKNLKKSRLKILAAHACGCIRPPTLLPESRLEGDEEMVYLHCDISRPWMTCDGLVCFPDPDWIHVLNPSTRQLRRFPSGSNKLGLLKNQNFSGRWSWRGDVSMGFGREKVTGSYKVVKICYPECCVLSVETGEWLKLSPLPCYVVKVGAKSVCVNGSIYWLYQSQSTEGFKLLALDLDKQEFHDVSVPASWITYHTQIVNLEDRLVMAETKEECKLEILTMDAEEERWSKTYTISLAHTPTNGTPYLFRPVALSKQRDLVLYDNYGRLLKYNPGTHEIRCLSSDTRVIAPYLENLVPLPLKSSHPLPLVLNSDHRMFTPKCPFFDPRPWTSKPCDFMSLLVISISILLLCYCFVNSFFIRN